MQQKVAAARKPRSEISIKSSCLPEYKQKQRISKVTRKIPHEIIDDCSCFNSIPDTKLLILSDWKFVDMQE
jgi:hypothetical protein